MAVCKSLFILSLHGKVVPFIWCTLFSYLHTVMLGERFCDTWWEKWGVCVEGLTFSLLCLRTNGSRMPIARKYKWNKRHTCRKMQWFSCFCGLLRHVFILACVNVGIFASLRLIFTLHTRTEFLCNCPVVRPSPATTCSTTSLYSDWAKILKEECLIKVCWC